MDWKKWLGRIDRWAQSAWFWCALLFAAASGSLLMLGRATEIFLLWAPFSYGLAFWIAVPIALWCLVPLKRLIPKRMSRSEDLANRALLTSAIIRSHSVRLPETVDDAVRSTYSASLAFKAAGFPFPTFPPDVVPLAILPVAEHYFGTVGLLLRDGHLKEARDLAMSLTDRQSRFNEEAARLKAQPDGD